MRKLVKALLIVIGAVLVLLAAIWFVARAMGPTQAQRDALTLMEAKSTPAGRNAYPVLWLLPYDVPEAKYEAVTAEDAARFSSAPIAGTAAAKDFVWVSVADKRYGRIALPADQRPEYCGAWEVGCLAKVRSKLGAYQHWRPSEAKLIAKLESLANYDFVRGQMPARTEVPFPALQSFGVLPTLRAVDFAEGRTDAALDGVCRDISMLRKFAGQSDQLIMEMVSVAYDAAGSRLLAEMLQELPHTQRLPESCRALQIPPAPESLSICPAMRGEFALSSGVMDRSMDEALVGKSGRERLVARFFYSKSKSKALLAERFSWTCDAKAVASLQQDRPLMMPKPKAATAKDYVWCANNAAGCILSRIAAPAYADYGRRLQDMGARAQALGTLLWLREQADDPRPLAERIATRPADLKSPARAISVSKDGKALSIAMYDDKRSKTWELPLPSYLQEASAQSEPVATN